ncbi:MAG TPA: hypothetical protein VF736_20640 [Pyrinomonadaceae bacterium]|jgi:hypothetical protein
MRIIAAFFLLLCASTAALADLKVTRRAGAGGHESQSTVYIKGSRERTESPGMTTIRQCDLRRTIQINDRTRKYVVVPDAGADAAPAQAAPAAPAAPQRATRRGAVVTHTVTVNDTGERKQVFGRTARRIKSTVVMDAPQGACNPGRFEMESDGWYIDFADGGLSCDAGRPDAAAARGARPDCQDEVRYKQVGTAKLGFPVQVTTRMKVAGAGQDDDADAEAAAMMRGAMTSTVEVTDISTVTLDPALFDVPAGYAQAASVQELYGAPDMSSMHHIVSDGRPQPGAEAGGAEAGGADNAARPAAAAQPARPKQPGAVRVGVVAIGNRAGAAVSPDSLRVRLVNAVEGAGVEAVALDAAEPAAADAEARQKECDFVLFTDITSLKQSAAGKVGGMFGRAVGAVTGSDRYEARVDFRLVPVGGAGTQLELNVTVKEEGADATVGAALDREAKSVAAAARKKK